MAWTFPVYLVFWESYVHIRKNVMYLFVYMQIHACMCIFICSCPSNVSKPAIQTHINLPKSLNREICAKHCKLLESAYNVRGVGNYGSRHLRNGKEKLLE